MNFTKIIMPFRISNPVLALGSNTKNTICFAKDNIALVSPIHDDLSDPGDFAAFESSLKYCLRQKPRIIAADLHPGYASAGITERISAVRNAPYALRSVQHHHAHIAACMAENGLRNQKVIGVAFDGTGLGNDGTLWGAEFLICDYRGFERGAHLKEIFLLGGERAILEPFRLTALWLHSIYKDNFLEFDIGFIRKLDKRKWKLLKRVYMSGYNYPAASSMGRLFDAVASLVLEKQKVFREAELAMELEKQGLKAGKREARYKFQIKKHNHAYVIDPALVFKEIIGDLKRNATKEEIAYKFHAAVAHMVYHTCRILKREYSIRRVVLSGGVFQNKLLSGLSKNLLEKGGFKVFTHRVLSCNDSAISLGQAIIGGV